MRVWVQEWEESERGWGRRPDGWSCALDPKEFERHLDEMRRREAEIYQGAVPEEYTRASGEPFQIDLTDKAMLGHFAAGEKHVRGKGSTCPHPRLPSIEETM